MSPRTHRLLCLACALVAACARPPPGAAFERPADPVTAAESPTAMPTADTVAGERLHVLDLASAQARGERYYYDVQAAVAALQGIANRDAPRLFVRVPTSAEHENFWYATGPDYDQYWLDKLVQWGVVSATTSHTHLSSVLDVGAVAGNVRGVVLWDAAVPATLNAAFTAAAAEDLLPVRRTSEPGSLYEELVVSGRLPVVKDVTSLPSKAAVYRWVLDHYVYPGRTQCSLMGYVLDGYALGRPYGARPLELSPLGQPLSQHVYNNQLLARDYLVARRAPMFDLQPYASHAPVDDPGQPLGTDLALLEELLSACRAQLPPGTLGGIIGFPNWLWKYAEFSGGKPGWDVEWDFARLISRYAFFKDADAAHPAGMSNASVYQHVPLPTRAPHTPPPRPPYEAERVYVHIYMGDFDSASWVWFHGRFLWDDPARGQVPLSWGFNPNLSERVPMAFRHFFETATPNDFFVGGDTGAGYLNPGALDADGLSRWEAHCTRWYERLGYSMTGWALNGHSGAFSRESLEAFARCSPGGIVTHDGQYDGAPITLAGNGTPVVAQVRDVATGQPIAISLRNTEPPEQLAQALLAHVPKSRLVSFRNVLMEPKRIVQLAQALEARGARVLDPHSFFAFARRRASIAPQGICPGSACYVTTAGEATDGHNPDPAASPAHCAEDGARHPGTGNGTCWSCQAGAWVACPAP